MADKKRMKGITCCGDCVYYDWKKHKCSRGASAETDAREPFYDDCPIPDVEQLDEKEIRAKAIDEFAEKLKKHLNEFDFWKYGISDGTNYETRNYDHMIDEIAEQMKAGE